MGSLSEHTLQEPDLEDVVFVHELLHEDREVAFNGNIPQEGHRVQAPDRGTYRNIHSMQRQLA